MDMITNLVELTEEHLELIKDLRIVLRRVEYYLDHQKYESELDKKFGEEMREFVRVAIKRASFGNTSGASNRFSDKGKP